ncbi:MAG: GGDEF domain-containing protein [Sporomusaceae bacterium]|jgi:diguanylate cyclase (GGDEF)-like protein|nr:GGDEF domain-containing protein [Sporomusaceae bacterium]
MVMDFSESIKSINEALALILANKPCPPLPTETIAPALRETALKINELAKRVCDLHCSIAGHKEREIELETYSFTDSLTGIYNRRAFDTYAKREWQSAIRHNLTLAALMIDIDHFKIYNDTYGHQQGDVCLQVIAERIKSVIKRSTDIFARYGGEEFVAFLPNTELEPALELAEKIRAAIEKTEIALLGNPNVKTGVTVSIGVATCLPAPNITEAALCQQADIALYLAKKSGRNCVRVSQF